MYAVDILICHFIHCLYDLTDVNKFTKRATSDKHRYRVILKNFYKIAVIQYSFTVYYYFA